MTCCNVITKPFVNEATTIIPYSGNKPTVTVSYLIGGVWQALGVMTQAVFTPTSIFIDHGGPSTGVVKIVQ